MTSQQDDDDKNSNPLDPEASGVGSTSSTVAESGGSLTPPNGPNIVTRHRKTLLHLHSDLEDGRATRHSVPSPHNNNSRRSRNSNANSSTNANRSRGSSRNSRSNSGLDSFGGGAPERWLDGIRESLRKRSCQDWLVTFLPAWGWLQTYPWKEYGLSDVMAGLTVAVMIVPQSMSYAKLAGLPVEFGLYSSLVPIYAYAVFGSSRQLAVGPVALISLLLNTGLTMVLEGQGKTPDTTPDYQVQYATMALQTSVLVGLLSIGMGTLKLGFVANFLSHAVVSGFTSAAAIIIGLSQVKYVFGYNIPNDKSLHKMLYNIFSNIDQFNWRTFLLGTSCIASLVGLKRLAQSFPRFKWAKAAGPLVVTVISIVLQATLDLDAKGIPIVGYIPKGLPSFSGSLIFPVDFGSLAVVVFSVLIVGFMESIAIAKKLAQKHGYELDASMEMVGLGMANLSSGLFGGYPVTGSFSRSAVNSESGAQSGISAIVTATMVAMTLLFLTTVFELLPLATLASIVISGVISLVDYPEATYLWKVHKFDFGVWVTAFVGTLFLGVELGLGIAVGISLLLVLFESAYPPMAQLGRLPGTHTYRNIKQYPDAQTYDGIICVRVDAPLYFANTQHVRDKVQKYYERASEKLRSYDPNFDDQPSQKTAQEVVAQVEFVILELSAVSHIDTSALHALQEMASTFRKTHEIQLCFANPNPRVMHRLVSSGLAEEIGRQHIYVALHDAIDDCLHHMDRQELKRVHESALAIDQLVLSSQDNRYDDNDNDSHIEDSELLDNADVAP